jgi:hypothetical protein
LKGWVNKGAFFSFLRLCLGSGCVITSQSNVCGKLLRGHNDDNKDAKTKKTETKEVWGIVNRILLVCWMNYCVVESD